MPTDKCGDNCGDTCGSPGGRILGTTLDTWSFQGIFLCLLYCFYAETWGQLFVMLLYRKAWDGKYLGVYTN